MSILWEKSAGWRWLVRRTRDSKPFFFTFAALCGVVPGVIGYGVMQLTSSRNEQLEAHLRSTARPETAVRARASLAQIPPRAPAYRYSSVWCRYFGDLRWIDWSSLHVQSVFSLQIQEFEIWCSMFEGLMKLTTFWGIHRVAVASFLLLYLFLCKSGFDARVSEGTRNPWVWGYPDQIDYMTISDWLVLVSHWSLAVRGA